MSQHSSSPLPQTLSLEGEPFEFELAFKNDWLSAVGLYRSESGAVILKHYRARSLYGLPVRWLTSRMARRESKILKSAEDIAGVPRSFGTHAETGIIHEFLEGHPLRRDEAVRAEFFPSLDKRLEAIHARGIAYVDLSKRDNILMGADGLPCLIDFQIAWVWPCRGIFGLLPGFIGRALLARLQRADRHHVLKHRSRVAPESLNQEQLEALSTPTLPIRIHRFLVRPYQKWRRRRQWKTRS